MQFMALDLNLLRVFVVLMDEGNATRAGERLNLSPSAVSHALSRLRDRLGDPLFIRGSASLRPTPRALEMAPLVRRAMEDLERAVSFTPFDPATSEREFVVVASAYGCSVLLPKVAAALREASPGSKLRIRAPGPGLAEALDQGMVDVVVCAYEEVPPRFTYDALFEETAVWVVRGKHPAAKQGLSIGKLSMLSRIAVSALDPWNGEDSTLDGSGLKRPVGWSEVYMQGLETMPAPSLWAPDVHTAREIVLETDMTALLPRRLVASALRAGQLVEAKTAYIPPAVRIGAITAKAGANTPAQWLKQLMVSSSEAERD